MYIVLQTLKLLTFLNSIGMPYHIHDFYKALEIKLVKSRETAVCFYKEVLHFKAKTLGGVRGAIL